MKHHSQMYESSDRRIASFPTAPANVTFQRSELAVIMPLYGRMVAAGEWRDYGISHLAEVAVFSAFRRTAENPFCRIEKHPAQEARQGCYRVVAMDGSVLARGNDLRAVLRVLEKKLIRLVKD